MKRLFLTIAAIFILVQPVVGTSTAGEKGIPQKRVQFAKGASSAVIKGQLKGDSDVDYLVRAGAGQTITVSLKKSNLSNYFNVLPPGSKDVAMYAGQTGEDFKGLLPTGGDYTIRVYLVRAAARRNETSNYTLNVSVTGKALAPLPASKDALIPGTHFHASAPITCVPYIEKFREKKVQQ
jgi:hypothetical protein